MNIELKCRDKKEQAMMLIIFMALSIFLCLNVNVVVVKKSKFEIPSLSSPTYIRFKIRYLQPITTSCGKMVLSFSSISKSDKCWNVG